MPPTDHLEQLRQRWDDLLWPGCACGESREQVGLRVNTLLQPVDEASETLTAAGLELAPVPWSGAAFTVPRAQRDMLVRHELVEGGAVYVQSLASQLAVVLLDPQPGEEMLDLCAAPGGKTLDIAQRMRGEGRLAAVEAVRARFFKLRANLERGGAGFVKTYQSDGRRIGKKVPERFDRVLLDAPCSADSHVDLATPDSARYWSLRKVKECARKQRGLLLSAIDATRPGGLIVYSTCASAPEENEAVLQFALEKAEGRVELELVTLPDGVPAGVARSGLAEWNGNAFDPAVTGAARLLPRAAFEVFFIAKLRKR